MNWKRKYLSFALVTILCISGVLSGCNKEAKPKTTEKSDATTVSEQIAVVNEDTGVEYPSGTVNYSDEFIRTLNDDVYVVTSSAEAEEGLKDGTFAGLLIFPENLSYSILNINYGNPQKIELGYSISEVADKEISDETHKRIINSYQKFNDRLSYAYINALLEEVEQGQNDVGKIFGNDASILAAAAKFSDGDYDSEYQDPVLPRNTLDYSEHNTDEFRESGVSYAKDVNDLYEEAYKYAHREETKKHDVVTARQNVDSSASNINTLYGKLQLYRGDLDSYYKNTIVGYAQSVDGYVASVGDYTKNVDDYINSVNAYKSFLDNYLQGNLETLSPEEMAKFDEEWGKVTTAAEKIAGDDKKPNSDVINQPKEIEFTETPPTEAEIKSALSDFEEKTATLGDEAINLASGLEPENILNKAMNTGDGNQTYKQMIDDKKDNFNTKASDTTKEFNRIQSDNIGKLTESYEKNNKYMTETVEALNKKSEKDQETLKKAIGDFLKTAKGNSADTKKRLESFRSMLEKAKVEGRISSAVVEFLIQPIQLEEYISN